MERDHIEYLGVDGRVILKSNFNKLDVEAWTGLLWLTVRAGVGCL
jgi:hypothetical protein